MLWALPDVMLDPIAPHVPAYTGFPWPGAAGSESSQCKGQPGAIRVANLRFSSDHEVAVYGRIESATRAHVCARIDFPATTSAAASSWTPRA